MLSDTHFEIDKEKNEPLAAGESELEPLRANAAALAKELAWLPDQPPSDYFAQHVARLNKSLRRVLAAFHAPLPAQGVTDDMRWLHDNVWLVDSQLQKIGGMFKSFRKLPQVRARRGTVVPRVAAIAEVFLAAADYRFSERAFAEYVAAFQQSEVLQLRELWALVPALRLGLLEQIAIRGEKVLEESSGSHKAGACISSLREVDQTSFKEVMEPLIIFDQVLRKDPSGTYAGMDFESRDLYRKTVAQIAESSDCTETEVAQEALTLAQEAERQPHADARVILRSSHVGHYLLGDGRHVLLQKVGFRPSFGERIRSFLRKYPDEFYLTGVEILTFAIVSAAVLLLMHVSDSFGLVLFSMLVLLLPASQSAVQLMNYLVMAVMHPQILPKLDFREGIPGDCVTLVAVPTLLLNEKQVRHLIEDLEVRFLGNHDANLHFALVTDLPDSHELAREDDPLVNLCSELIADLNRKYSSEGKGSFLLLHRHRIYNPRERVWMGWERKRGKLMDLNKLLRGEHDSFPVKAGDVTVLPKVRFVITLDSDTELPRGSARRMVGAIAHPMNQAIIDPEKNIVVAGYGILQPRVGVSVQSASFSRLAAIYSGETGFDIYTRAMSDVYQDLYGSAIFAGKGIYEVQILHRVLDRRFPRNALLSHDLIEGAYARAGLVSDIEIIEDYPSHYSAYNRRKHRWLRGDWQIASWLGSSVPDESGHRVPNPISLISQWKILDNLRRSLVEPATLLLLLLGWLVLPRSAARWTIATIIILFLPAWFQFLFSVVQAGLARKWTMVHDAVSVLLTANVNLFFTLTFLAHQTMVSLDAVIRTLVRRMVTGRRLLEWETAAQVEMGAGKRTPVDISLNWVPALAVGLFLLVFFVRRPAVWAAVPILLLWCCSKVISTWLDRPPRALHKVAERDRVFLRRAALRTWRYFAEYSTKEHNWLIPDNVQEEPAAIAARVSPTNLGLLLNSRQAANEFGYLTSPEFAEQTLRTLATISVLPRHRGHLFNWYDTRTLEPLHPRFISSVDSGNLLASLWTLRQGCLARLRRPVIEPALAEGLLDHLRLLHELGALPRRRLSRFERQCGRKNWLPSLLSLPDMGHSQIGGTPSNPRNSGEAQWLTEQAKNLLQALNQTVSSHQPWLLPQFASLRDDPALNLKSGGDQLPLERLPDFIDSIAACLQFAINSSSASAERAALCQRLLDLLPEARSQVLRHIQDLRTIAETAGRLANDMDFRFLLDRRRKLLSVGFDAESQRLQASCYDLLASEARTAFFVAIAKEDIPQESWFLLGREQTIQQNLPVLLSWTGTMFEYLMPAVWMRTYPNTLLQRSRRAAVRVQQEYGISQRIPWGVSECAYFETDAGGTYQYYAFGLSSLALHKGEIEGPVVSPYSTMLALQVDPGAAVENLRSMAAKGWLGPFGFYEAADYNRRRRPSWLRRYGLVRCWMAHHQGMSLLSLANFLHDGVVQRWFHADPRVQATELLLHEKPVAHTRPVSLGYWGAAA